MSCYKKKYPHLICLVLLLLLPVSLVAQDDTPVPIDQTAASSQKNAASLADYYASGAISLPAEIGNVVQIDMTQAVRIALEQNLQLQAETYAARAAKASLQGKYGLYDPLLTFRFVEGEANSQVNPLLAPVYSATDEYVETALSLQQKFPLGTELTLSGSRLENDASPAPTIDPSYVSVARLSLVQPLLKGFGVTATEEQIIYAVKDHQIALQDLRASAFQVVADTRNAYLATMQARYELSYRETSVKLARRIVEENSARVEAGILAPVEKIEAEFGLQTRERLLLDAQRAFADQLDSFNLLLNASEQIYVPVIQSFSMEFTTSEEGGVESGLLQRPDVLRRMKAIEKTRAGQSIATNKLLPELNLVASYSQSGLGESSGSSADVVRDGDFDSWAVGVELAYPLGSIEGRNELKKVDLALKQERLLLTQLHQQVRNEVRSAIRKINVSRKKTEVAGRGHELAREKLRILIKSREVGLATTRDVLDGEEDLAIARTDQIASVAEYFKAITEYLRVTGTLLEFENISFSGDFGPAGTRPLFRMKP